ncbi:MAG: TonB-dependent receptor [Caulobacter sp.]|nr:TonB-dependent receptor [Caulobacter sp.]
MLSVETMPLEHCVTGPAHGLRPERRHRPAGSKGIIVTRAGSSDRPVRRLVAVVACAAGALSLPPCPAAAAPPAPARAVTRFDIPPQPLGAALNQLALQASREILFAPALTAGRQSPGLRGTFSPEAALDRLLTGAGLVYRLEGGSFLVQAAPRTTKATTNRAHPAPSGPPPAIDSIVVTALKRPTLMQETPVSMIVVSGQTLNTLSVVELERAAAQLPGLKLIASAFGRRLVLRGVNGAGEATTGLYYDETPVTGPVGTTSDPGVMAPELLLVDVDQIELLRGPQGTLFGASSLGGTLRVLFKRPDLTGVSGMVSLTGATAAHGETTGGGAAVFNQPLVEGRLGARLVLYDQTTPGTIDNVRLGLKDVDTSHAQGARLSLLWAPDERTSLQVSGAAQASRRDDISAWHESVGPWRTEHAARAPFDGQIRLANATLRSRLGDAAVTASSSWYRWRLTRRSDYSGVLIGERGNAAACGRYFNLGDGACDGGQMAGYTRYVDGLYPAILNQPATVTSWINEVRAASSGDGPFAWTLGLYDERRDDRIDSQVLHVDPASGVPTEPATIIGRRSIENQLRQTAVFGEAVYAPRPGTHLTLGARWFDYRKRDRGEVQIPNVVSGTYLGYQIDATTPEDGWSFKLLVDHKLARDVMAYAQLSQGYRPGGVNVVPGLPDSLAAYRSDRLTNYEIGLKSQWLERRLTANLALYQIDWRDMQYSAQTRNRAFSFLTNIGASRIRGLEAAFEAKSMAGWDADLSLTYTDARLTADQVTNTAIGVGLKGERLPTVPKLAATAAVERRWALPSGAELSTRLDASYAGVAWGAFNASNVNYLKAGGYATFGATLGLSQGDWRADLTVDNLLDRAGKAQAARNTAGPVEIFGIAPRTARLTVERRF